MAYNPYNDIRTVAERAKNDGITVEDVYRMVKNAESYYKSEAEALEADLQKTKDYIRSDGAYNDEGAKSIRRTYADYADANRGHIAAKVAAANGGNLNSYAAAQANRAARDMLTAGEEAVRERAESIYEGLISLDKLLAESYAESTKRISEGTDTAGGLADTSANERKSALTALLDYYGLAHE